VQKNNGGAILTFVHIEVFQEPQELVSVSVKYSTYLERLFLVEDEQLIANIFFNLVDKIKVYNGM
jgi:hypothetical protein